MIAVTKLTGMRSLNIAGLKNCGGLDTSLKICGYIVNLSTYKLLNRVIAQASRSQIK